LIRLAGAGPSAGKAIGGRLNALVARDEFVEPANVYCPEQLAVARAFPHHPTYAGYVMARKMPLNLLCRPFVENDLQGCNE
jgi:hypothetical protein